MAAQGHVEDSFTFVGGLNTEGAFFLTPKNCWKEGDNVIPQTDGSVERRKALTFETGFQYNPDFFGGADRVYTTHLWKAVGGNGNLDILVVQSGESILFYDALGGAVSQRLLGVVNFAGLQAVGNTDVLSTIPIQTAVAFGDLIVTSQACDPFVVRYVNGSFVTDRITLKMRDFTGVYMGTAITNEGTLADWDSIGLRAAALYNLYNQGWNPDQLAAYSLANGGRFPSNTKSWIYGKNATDDFDAAVLNKQDFGTSPAPKGRVILDVFNQVREFTDYGITSVTAPDENWQDNRIFGNVVGPTNTTIYTNFIRNRPRACGFFGGRIWYAGINNKILNGHLFFTQVANEKDRFGKCYQENDPTSEVFSDLLDSDGGVIVIPEIGEIVALRGTSNTLVIFASNGIWSIVGGDNGFKATQYIVSKVSNVGCVSAESIVEVEDTFMFWSLTGIYAMKIGQLGEGAVQNVSDTNIKAFYNGIAISEKLSVSGVYDYINKRVEWLYGNKSLSFDVRLQAWYTFTFDTTNPLVGILVTTQAADLDQEFDIVVNNAGVLDDVEVGADQVVIDYTTINNGASVVKYVTSSLGIFITFSDLASSGFSDWNTTEMPAYILTGYSMGNNGPARQKTAGYMSVFMKRTETAFDSNSNPIGESGCLLQTRWDFTDNSNPGKWGQEYQVYRLLRPYLVNGSGPFDDGYPLVITKNKIRGRGKGLQIKLSAETGKDMKLVGWSMTFIGNTNV
jgi:hypothetical protein